VSALEGMAVKCEGCETSDQGDRVEDSEWGISEEIRCEGQELIRKGVKKKKLQV